MTNNNKRVALQADKKEQLNAVLESLKEAMLEANESGDAELSAALQETLDQVANQAADCFAVVLDQCTIELQNAGGTIISTPPIFSRVINDPFSLECCISPTTVDAVTECGILPDAATVNEVRATGPLNYYLTFDLNTYFNDGNQGCADQDVRPFVCTGSTCVDEVLCYTPLDEVDACPDFCNGAVFSFAVRCSLCEFGDKITATYVIVHLLPNCN
ncbi:hypothetical protein FZC84_00710 [Rossellomorea vietnamensis]|uniref:Uncharacterized protein n=1 Tax=Rossellomorea vietnamensis TaxID=218284 RepID=A0A5D4MIT5_9BACI|nr:hypothetical protein [Rossellomorea vietnamensis]TYS01224.1 hypothetical protein FZC84_00710 [Rossellomorea vietnamensis]